MKQLAAFCAVSDTPEFSIHTIPAPFNVRDIEILASPQPTLGWFKYRLLLGDVGPLSDLRLLYRLLDASNLESAILTTVPLEVGGKFGAGLPCIDVVLSGSGGIQFAVVSGLAES